MFGIKNLFKKEEMVKENAINVVYQNKSVKSRFLYLVNAYFNDSIDNALMSLGFNIGDTVYLYEHSRQLFEFHYSVNEDLLNINNSIKVNINDSQIVVSNNDIERCYNYSLNNKLVSLDYYNKKISDNVFCFRSFINDGLLFRINNGDYSIDLELFLNNSDNLDKGDMLENYLINLKFPIVIEELYKKICEILNVNSDDYNYFNLVVSKTKNMDEEKDVVDLIKLYDGKLYEIVRTAHKRRISLDRDGNWSYDKVDNDSVLSVKYNECNNPKYRYSFKDRSENQEGYFSGRDFLELRNSAEYEVNDVKKLARIMISNNNR